VEVDNLYIHTPIIFLSRIWGSISLQNVYQNVYFMVTHACLLADKQKEYYHFIAGEKKSYFSAVLVGRGDYTRATQNKLYLLGTPTAHAPACKHPTNKFCTYSL
jgi:hypothetical protein